VSYEPICGLTWDVVQARSSAKLGRINTFCAICFMQFHHSGTPCSKHILPEEKAEYDARCSEMMLALALEISRVP